MHEVTTYARACDSTISYLLTEFIKRLSESVNIPAVCRTRVYLAYEPHRSMSAPVCLGLQLPRCTVQPLGPAFRRRNRRQVPTKSNSTSSQPAHHIHYNEQRNRHTNYPEDHILHNKTPFIARDLATLRCRRHSHSLNAFQVL